jgi:hypothetical protein
MNESYAEKLALGEEYQDFIGDTLYRRGLALRNYTSRKYQLAKGENMFGLEIKHDTQIAKYGNLFIEVTERAHTGMPFVASGIYAANSVLYLIGDMERYFLFATNILKAIHRSQKYPVETIRHQTSQGFKLPIKDVREGLWHVEEYVIPKETHLDA